MENFKFHGRNKNILNFRNCKLPICIFAMFYIHGVQNPIVTLKSSQISYKNSLKEWGVPNAHFYQREHK